MKPAEINEFLTWLAVKRNLAAATQTQALAATVPLYTKGVARGVLPSQGSFGRAASRSIGTQSPRVTIKSQPLIMPTCQQFGYCRV